MIWVPLEAEHDADQKVIPRLVEVTRPALPSELRATTASSPDDFITDDPTWEGVSKQMMSKMMKHMFS
eukprot:3635360-Pyramimonas_sp.AAC.1